MTFLHGWPKSGWKSIMILYYFFPMDNWNLCLRGKHGKYPLQLLEKLCAGVRLQVSTISQLFPNTENDRYSQVQKSNPGEPHSTHSFWQALLWPVSFIHLLEWSKNTELCFFWIIRPLLNWTHTWPNRWFLFTARWFYSKWDGLKNRPHLFISMLWNDNYNNKW